MKDTPTMLFRVNQFVSSLTTLTTTNSSPFLVICCSQGVILSHSESTEVWSLLFPHKTKYKPLIMATAPRILQESLKGLAWAGWNMKAVWNMFCSYLPKNIISAKMKELMIATRIMLKGLNAVTKTGPFVCITTPWI